MSSLKIKLLSIFLFSIFPVSAKPDFEVFDRKCQSSYLIDIQDDLDKKYSCSNSTIRKLNNKIEISKDYFDGFSYYLNKHNYDVLAEIPIPETQKDLRTLDKKSLTSIEIEANTQYESEGKFFAEGNAEVKTMSGTLYADKISFDRNNKIFIATGNVRIFRGNQFIQSTNFKYDYSKEIGELINVYGTMDLSTFNKDLNLQEKVKKIAEISYLEKLKNMQMIDESNIGFSQTYERRSPKINFELSSISKWRFKANKVNFTSSSFSSDEIFFTNDAYNKPQFLIQSKNFSGEFIENKLKINSKSSFLILDDRLRIPIGKRTIYEKENVNSWGFGSDYAEKDGIYVYRSSQPIKFTDKFLLKITPYILIQRYFKGNTKNFVPKDAYILSPKKKDNTDLLDYFAVDFDLKGFLGDWELEWNSTLNSLNLERSHDLLKSNLLLTKKLFETEKDKINKVKSDDKLENKYEKDLDLEIFSSFRKPVWKGFRGNNEIYFAYGTRLKNYSIWNYGKTNNQFDWNLEIGSFKAKKNDENRIISRERYTLSGSYGSRYQLWSPKDIDKVINEDYKYSPIVINQGIFFTRKFSLGIFQYSDGNTQKALEVKFGPDFIFGEKKDDFLDFTRLKIEYSYTFRNGESPFAFDNINDSSFADIQLQQQIYGPLLFTLKTSINLDGHSSDYGKFKNNRYELSFNRRAYLINLYVEPNEERVGIDFKIFNFIYTGSEKSF